MPDDTGPWQFTLGPTKHLSADELADLGEGLLPIDDARAAEDHVERCPHCRSSVADLADLSSLLASAAHVSMPTDVADRLEAALARAAAEPVAEAIPATAAPSPPASLAAARERRRGTSRGRLGAALIGVAAALGVAFAVTQSVDLTGGGDDSTTESGTAFGAADGPVDTGATVSGELVEDAELTAGPAYTSATLLAGVARLVTAQATGPQALAPSAATRDDGAVTESRDAGVTADTSSCVAAIAAESGIAASPLAVDVGTYDAQPAVVVVLPLPPEDGADAEIWVVSSGCLASHGGGELEVVVRMPLPHVPDRP